MPATFKMFIFVFYYNAISEGMNYLVLEMIIQKVQSIEVLHETNRWQHAQKRIKLTVLNDIEGR